MSGSNIQWNFDGRKLPANPYSVFIKTCGNFSGPENLTLTEFDESPWVKDDAFDCFYTASMQWAPPEASGLTTCKILDKTSHPDWPEGASIIPGVGSENTTGLVKVGAKDGKYTLMPNPEKWKAVMAGTFWGFDPVKRHLIFVTTNAIRHVTVDGPDAPQVVKQLDYSMIGLKRDASGAVNSTNLASTQFACDWLGRKLYFFWPEVLWTPDSVTVLASRMRVMQYDLEWDVTQGNTQGGITYSGSVFSPTSPWTFMADPPVGPKAGSKNLTAWYTAPNGVVGVLLFDTRKRRVVLPEMRDGAGVCFSLNFLDPLTNTWAQPWALPMDADGVPNVARTAESPGGTYACYDETSAVILTAGIIFYDNLIPAVDAWEQTIKTKFLHWIYRP